MLLWLKEEIRGGRHAEIRTEVDRDGVADEESMLETREMEKTMRYYKWLGAE